MTPGVLPAPSRDKSINLGGIKPKRAVKIFLRRLIYCRKKLNNCSSWSGKASKLRSARSLTIANSFCAMRLTPGGQIMVEALLLGLVAFIAQSEYALGRR